MGNEARQPTRGNGSRDAGCAMGITSPFGSLLEDFDVRIGNSFLEMQKTCFYFAKADNLPAR